MECGIETGTSVNSTHTLQQSPTDRAQARAPCWHCLSTCWWGKSPWQHVCCWDLDWQSSLNESVNDEESKNLSWKCHRSNNVKVQQKPQVTWGPETKTFLCTTQRRQARTTLFILCRTRALYVHFLSSACLSFWRSISWRTTATVMDGDAKIYTFNFSLQASESQFNFLSGTTENLSRHFKLSLN